MDEFSLNMIGKKYIWKWEVNMVWEVIQNYKNLSAEFDQGNSFQQESLGRKKTKYIKPLFKEKINMIGEANAVFYKLHGLHKTTNTVRARRWIILKQH